MLLNTNLTKKFTEAVNKKPKKTLNKIVRSHIRRSLVQLANTLFGNIIFYILIGIFNRLAGLIRKISGSKKFKPIRGIFVFYAPNKKYLRTMIYDWYAPIVKWKPGLGQIMRQNGHWIISCGVTARDVDFNDPANKEKIKKMLQRAEKIAWAIGAEQLSFAGVIPSAFDRLGIERKFPSVEQKNTVEAVIRAVYKVINLKKELLYQNSPIIVLGGDGYIGKKTISRLAESGYQGKIIPLDIKLGHKSGELPSTDQVPIILNISKCCAVQDYVPNILPGTVVINEVFPEPTAETISAMENKAVTCYHITGIKGEAIPSMGGAYEGGIPCCASFKPKKGEGEYNVLVKKLTR